MMKRQLELLSPAKNLECGIAAIEHGADAVYIGAHHFGARAAAGNSIDDIRQLCLYAHQFGAKVYATVNTIVYNQEMEAARKLLAELKEAGVDAILVQDFGLAQSFHQCHCQLPITFHASTQTDNRTAEKVKWLGSLGFKRVVLARELSVDEIAEIHHQVPDVELEVFVHGALCVSYSGLCYASQYCFGRSANRGECAQFCRMKFDLIDAEGRMLEHQRHLLSLKDLNLSQHLGRLIEAGACSFKIEGRLKDVAYVKNVTAAYSELLNQYIAHHPDQYERSSKGHCRYTFKPDLQKTFNRGYTTYFLNGRQKNIASFDTPKAMGEFVGTVKELRGNSFTVAGTASFSNGDGLCFIDENRELQGFRVNRVEGNRLFPLKMPMGLHSGLHLFRNNDQEMERVLSKVSSERKIPVKMGLRATSTGFELNIDDAVATIETTHQQAEKPQRENIIRQLTKLGGTPFECTDIDLPAGFNYFIPSSQLAELRRRAVALRLSHNESSPTPPMVCGQSTDSLPQYSLPYLYNVANDDARSFYEQQGIATAPAFEQQSPDEPLLMQCRHCLRYALGHCTKLGGKKAEWHEPLFLRMGDGHRFRLEFDCRQCQMNVYAVGRWFCQRLGLMLLLCCMAFSTACYHQVSPTPDAWVPTEEQMDSISFYTTHHYTQNYNFRVTADSIQLIVQHPSELLSEMLVDTIAVNKNDILVVADIETLSSDTIDSVWVRVARDQQTIGWIRESKMLTGVAPDNPISQFIDFFSDSHMLIMLAFLVLVAAAFIIRRLFKRKAKIVHFNDIPSFYPILLVLLVSVSAVFYSTIQLFDPDSWRHYYYHPTLNPFAVPLHLELFLFSVWAMLLVLIAAFDDIRRHLSVSESIFYYLGLVGVCSIDYVVFTVTTLYYIGYPLLIAYIVFALWRYYHTNRPHYVCGRCGHSLLQKGICPHCGAENV